MWGIILAALLFNLKTFFMEKMNDLKTLLMHDVQLLHSCEQQIIEALPMMIQRASNSSLKNALEQHLRVTERQLNRIDQVRGMLGADESSVKEYSGLLANLMGGAKCKGMDGLIEEGQKVMAENLSDEVMDAAIIGGCQKIEHYEIACYGTVRTYAEQLGLTEVASLLEQTLNEEYEADELLTSLAKTNVNREAQAGTPTYA
jgi:ferritin-like metal-binding protein YciE